MSQIRLPESSDKTGDIWDELSFLLNEKQRKQSKALFVLVNIYKSVDLN